jgi:hypothetical protein
MLKQIKIVKKKRPKFLCILLFHDVVNNHQIFPEIHLILNWIQNHCNDYSPMIKQHVRYVHMNSDEYFQVI